MRTVVFLFLAFLVAGATAHSSLAAVEEPPDSGWLRQSPTRTRLPLNGIWEWRREGEKVWKPIRIPSAFDFVGEATYRRSFEVDSSLAGRSFVLVGWGANYQVVVMVNGRFVGTNSGYFSGFEIEIPSALIRVGRTNELVLSISNRLDPRHTLPLRHQPGGRRNYGGIFRDLFLFALPPNRVESARARLTFSADYERSAIRIEASLKRQLRDRDDIRCAAEVWDPRAGRVVARSPEIEANFEDRVSAEVELPLEIDQPHLWTLRDPFLYELRLSLSVGDSLVDQFRQPLGLRQVSVSPDGLALNGRVIAGDGVDWVEGYGPAGSPVASVQAMERAVAQMKELGARFVHIVAHPPHPYLLDLADREGLLVFLEIPLRGVPAQLLAQPEIGDMAESAVRSMILRYGEHPSVVAWGIGYGLNAGLQAESRDLEADPALRILSRLRRIASDLDNRPVYYVARSMQELDLSLPVDLAILDLFERSPADIFRRFAATDHGSPRLPFLARIGYSLEPRQAQRSRLVDPRVRVEEHQAYRLEQAMARLRETSTAAGVVIRALTDWGTATPPANVSWDGGNRIYPAGLRGLRGQKRVAFALVQADFTGDTPPHISQVPDVVWRPTLFPILGVATLIVFVFFLNRDRRLRGHLRRVFVHPHGFYLELREMRKVPPFLTSLLLVVEVIVVASLVSAALLPFRGSLLFDEVVDLVLPAVWLKARFAWLLWHPVLLVGAWSVLFALLLCGLAGFVWLLGLLVGRRLPYGQSFTLVVWAGASFLWMLAVVPIFFRLVQEPLWRSAALTLLAVSIAWFGVRLFRAIRAVYFLTFLRALFLVGFFLILVGFSIALYYDRTQALFAYLPYYLSLIAAY